MLQKSLVRSAGLQRERLLGAHNKKLKTAPTRLQNHARSVTSELAGEADVVSALPFPGDLHIATFGGCAACRHVTAAGVSAIFLTMGIRQSSIFSIYICCCQSFASFTQNPGVQLGCTCICHDSGRFRNNLRDATCLTTSHYPFIFPEVQDVFCNLVTKDMPDLCLSYMRRGGCLQFSDGSEVLAKFPCIAGRKGSVRSCRGSERCKCF